MLNKEVVLTKSQLQKVKSKRRKRKIDENILTTPHRAQLKTTIRIQALQKRKLRRVERKNSLRF